MYTLGIDIGSTTVKVAVLDKDNKILFSDYKKHCTKHLTSLYTTA